MIDTPVWPEIASQSDLESRAAEKFARDIANHTLVVRHESSDVTYLTARENGGVGFNWFDVTVTPTSVTIHGDMGTYVFARHGARDQLSLFRTDRVNVAHWTQKCVAGELDEYSRDAYVETVIERAEAQIEERELGEAEAEAFRSSVVSELLGPWDAENEAEAYAALSGTDLLEVETCDVNLSRPTYHFLWCLHALRWTAAAYAAPRTEDRHAA